MNLEKKFKNILNYISIEMIGVMIHIVHKQIYNKYDKNENEGKYYLL